ncbi:MAG: hypothetical protein [Wendovervirus sonii]|uniref:Uncharacterized protein n=1 Tax=phage Lak_Megaphage_Sonny TaxID=3109229 RepID=A0ABZ0Z6D2_9CAUD|nr:MAG: hypothetical protein [phage Lak_Megaphage_Sonny]
MKKTVRKIIGIIFALLLFAGIFVISCNRPVTQPSGLDPIDYEKIDTPSNIIPPRDTDGANQNRWGL